MRIKRNLSLIKAIENHFNVCIRIGIKEILCTEEFSMRSILSSIKDLI